MAKGAGRKEKPMIFAMEAEYYVLENADALVVAEEGEETTYIVPDSNDEPESSRDLPYVIVMVEDPLDSEQSQNPQAKGLGFDQNKKSSAKNNGPLLSCSCCPFSTTTRVQLRQHMKSHSKVPSHECSVCNKKFKLSSQLRSHALTHTDNRPFPCKLCDGDAFRCDICSFTTHRKPDLMLHTKRWHTSDSPRNCKICGAVQPDKYTLKLHREKDHAGKVKYPCNTCDFAASSIPSLNSHMLIHQDLKPFLCDQCSQSFRKKQLLKRHLKLHHSDEAEKKKGRSSTKTASQKATPETLVVDVKEEMEAVQNTTYSLEKLMEGSFKLQLMSDYEDNLASPI
ncbi:unnamed protein product [Cyprideis torosa]|uniref:Uncharacterized protein n=1 Tax=Cyprideis torosa TaxID=163714 RepID=A0A7R8WK20_9CRUS|nr:unnamed protein product [Cyprideis torosa]CAG0902626.1 unnamed protein product [Cyprideis torosa]